MQYRFKGWQELGWAALVAATMVLLEFLLGLHPEQNIDWKLTAITLVGAMVRAAAGAVIAMATRPEPED